MSSRWLCQLQRDLDEASASHLLRRLRPLDACARIVQRDGKPLLNLASNDYLALAAHPHLRDAVIEAAGRFGVGSGASRLVTGDLHVHQQFERRFAVFKHAEAALMTPTGFAANFAAITSLAGPDDVILLDKLSHASIIDAARASGATVRTYPHLNVDKLARLLERYIDARRRIIATDSVFSMDGDYADLPALCELRDRFDAILIVDEAHATGLLGDTGSGLAEQQGVAGCIDVTVSTGGKALGSLGGIVTAKAVVIDTLIQRARHFIYTTAPPPTQVAALDAALDVIDAEPQRRHRVADLSRRLRARLAERGWPIDVPASGGASGGGAIATPIVPVIVHAADAALALSAHLLEEGFLVPAMRPPTVAPGTARLRISLRADLSDDDVDRLARCIGSPSDKHSSALNIKRR